jgi:hypothetical protein
MKVMRTAWTEEDNDRLRALVASGASKLRSAASLKRTLASVAAQARKLGVPFAPLREVRKKWNPES